MEVVMPETTIKKVEAGSSPKGELGQKYLVAGKRVSMDVDIAAAACAFAANAGACWIRQTPRPARW
jgi:hypothetical protein